MKWKPVDNDSRVQPATGKYSDWKPQIATDCGDQCVYCALPVGPGGGLDCYHVEHYRPKSKFGQLENTITNLYLACAVCNRFKSNDWPNEPLPDHRISAYPDPGVHDYCVLFDSDSDLFVVTGNTVASRYVVERLYLNRPQLRRERRIVNLSQRMAAARADVTSAASELAELDGVSGVAGLMNDAVQVLARVSEAYQAVKESAPYDLSEIRRPAKKAAKKKAARKTTKKKAAKKTGTKKSTTR